MAIRGSAAGRRFCKRIEQEIEKKMILRGIDSMGEVEEVLNFVLMIQGRLRGILYYDARRA